LFSLSDELDKHGVDAILLSVVFSGPPETYVDWHDVSPSGSVKFLSRAWRLSGDVSSAVGVDFARAISLFARQHIKHFTMQHLQSNHSALT